VRVLHELAARVRTLEHRLSMLAARGDLRRVDASGGTQRIDLGLLADESRAGAEHLEPYGFTSHPHPGAEAAALFLGGNRDHGLIVVVGDRRYRLKGLAKGEVALYDDLGTTIILRRGGRLEVRADELDLETTGDANVVAGGNGKLKATGIATVEGATVVLTATAAITIDAPVVDIQGLGNYAAHTHGGVESGSDSTGPVA